ncbi:MAG: ATP-binding cassette domain-containing protein [Gemmatimonadaceae bacterium]
MLAPVTILNDISFDVSLGEIVVVAGPRGAGKSTLIRCAGGVARPTFGRVLWLGTDAQLLGTTPSAAIVGETPLSPNSLTVEDALRYHCAMRDVALPAGGSRLRDIAERVGLSTLRRATVNALAPLALRRVALAEALAVDARVLLLDETATGLCPSAAEHFGILLRSLSQEGRGIVVASRERAVLPRLHVRRFTLLGGRLIGGECGTSLWTPGESRTTMNTRRRMP